MLILSPEDLQLLPFRKLCRRFLLLLQAGFSCLQALLAALSLVTARLLDSHELIICCPSLLLIVNLPAAHATLAPPFVRLRLSPTAAASLFFVIRRRRRLTDDLARHEACAPVLIEVSDAYRIVQLSWGRLIIFISYSWPPPIPESLRCQL